jgi:hypothetical protein
MKSLITASALLFFAAGIAHGQASGPGSQSNPETSKPAQTPAGNAGETTDKPKKKKVWTNDEISTVGGPGSISVVGRANDPTVAEPNALENSAARASAKQRQVAGYRDRLRQLNNQLEATDKQISDLRNFKATNTSASGGINMNHRYSMTPVEEQVRTLEEKKKQLQLQISAVEEQARKEGMEPGQLR